MTHSGGKKHKVGDNGQRYEVSYFCSADNKRKVFGWAEVLDGAEVFFKSINLHPTMSCPKVRDRKSI